MRLKCDAPLAIVKTVAATKSFIQRCRQHKIDYRVLGWGANQLLIDDANFIYLHLEFDFDATELDNRQARYRLPASLSLARLTSHAARYGVKGWEVFTGIPASLGGAIYMNAGTNLGEIGSVVERVGLLDANGNEREVVIDEKSFSYRHNNFCKANEVIIWADLIHHGYDRAVTTTIRDYLKLRGDTQPLKAATCGCMFKNAEIAGMTCRAGLSIDIMGLKGLSFGGVRVSHTHANFMENVAKASRDEVLKLSEIVRDELKLTFGVEFDLEVDTGERTL